MSDYIPEEVVAEILLRPPAKSLIRFTAVCKSWKSLPQSSVFIQTHLRRRNNDTNLLLLSVKEWNETHFFIHNLETGESKNLYNPILLGQQGNQNETSKFDVHGTCNGLVLLTSRLHHAYQTIIWNPSIRKFVNLPTLVRPKFVAFGYDMATQDYKVLRIISNPNGNNPCDEVQVYSLTRASWKRLSDSVVPYHEGYPSIGGFGAAVHSNGALHWLRRAFGIQRSISVVIFDMHNEIFRTMVVPDAITERARKYCISRYGESLAIVVLTDKERILATACVWVMNEYGATDSWNMLFSVRLEELLITNNKVLRFGLTKNGGILIFKKLPRRWSFFYVVSREDVLIKI